LRTFTIHLKQFGELEVRLACDYASAVTELLAKANITAGQVVAIGCHGQTVFHDPLSKYPFSLQMVDGNKLAAMTGIKTVCDFRRMDMAFGGSGAPLTPAFNQGFLNSSTEQRVILNLGGIANITILDRHGDNVIGFDTGPANCLIDLYVQSKFNQAYDANGDLARQGKVIPQLLAQMLQDPYFAMAFPKSTGKEVFHLEWIKQQLTQFNQANLADLDIIATLTELTAQSIADGIRVASQAKIDAIYACGGGAYNAYLLERIGKLTAAKVSTTEDLGMGVGLAEAVAFAWFAKMRIEHKQANYSSVTGTSRRCLLGTIYEA
jgi:anhydro-N-acetylmuramic acid kinase